MKKNICVFLSLSLTIFLAQGCYVNDFEDEEGGQSDDSEQTIDAEKLQQQISLFDNQVGTIVQNCNTATDMQSHINEVKQMEGVDDAWIDDESFCIVDKQGITHMWDFQQQETLEADEYLTRSSHPKPTAETRTKTRSTGNGSACLIMSNGDIYKPSLRTSVTQLFEDNGYDVTFVSGRDLTPDYFVKSEYQSDYARQSGLKSFASHDVYLILCHGSYSRGLHWIVTDMPATEINQQAFAKYPWTRYRNFGIYYTEGGNSHCIMISQNFFKDFSPTFTQRPIMFFCSCRSMQENQDFAKVFVNDLGAGVFVGYTTAIAFSHYAGAKFYELMLDFNYTFKGAISALDKYVLSYNKQKGEEIIGPLRNRYSDYLNWYPQSFNSTLNPHEGIDMGTRVKWAKWNIGTFNIYELGDSLRWGEITDWSKCLYQSNGSNGPMPTYICKIPSDRYGTVNNYIYKEENIGGNPEKDPVTASWGGSWRLPTKAEFEELLDETKFDVERIISTTPNYLRITSKSDPSKVLVFPYPDIDWFSLKSYVCPYWTSDYYHCINDKGENEMEAWSLLFAGTFPIMSDCPGYYAGYARGVQPK